VTEGRRRPLSTAFVDTSVLVRYLTGEPADLAEQAAQILERSARVQITDVAVMEAAYVLASLYRLSRRLVVDTLIGLVQKENVVLVGLDKSIAIDALLLCRPSNRVSFGDAMIWAAARSAGAAIIFSFDARFPHEGIDVRSSLS